MYQLIRARHRSDRRSGKWRDVELADKSVTTLSATYGDVRLYIEYPGDSVKVLHWTNVQTWLNGLSPDLTVQEWLTGLGNKTLPFDAKVPDETITLIKYAQAWHAGYDIRPVGTMGHVEQTISTGHKEDLLINHPSFTPEYIRDHSMITVNGYFHLCDWTSSGVRVIGGNDTVRKVNDNQIGIYSFETIGKLQYLQITDEMISGLSIDAPLWDATYITIPETVDIENKTVLLVTGGYLNVLSDVYTKVSDRGYRVRFANMGFLDRYLESVNNLDLSSLGLSTDPDNKTILNVKELKCNKCIRAYFKLPQSFLVIVDTPNLFHSYEPIESLGLPNRYVDDKYEQTPLVGAYGKALDYHTIKEPYIDYTLPKTENLWVYITSENRRYNYLAKTHDWTASKNIDAGIYPAYPYTYDSAFYRLIGTEE